MMYSRLTTLAGAIALALAMALPSLAEVTQEFHKTVPLSSNGTVDIENVNGNVDITGWNKNEVQIDAIKTASDQQKLDNINIDVNATSNSVEIKTRYPKGTNNNPGGVHYTLHVPQNARIDKVNLVNGSLTIAKITGEVNANLVNGKVQASDLTGTADLATVNGTIDATYNSLKNVQEIKLKSVNGTVNLTLPPSANADVDASVTNGSITTGFPLTVKGRFVGKSMSGTLGSGGVHIELSNVNGSIKLQPGQSTL
jgi:DUF4097 and DUF4098 domain-containing protein YvlB